ncbi:glycosyltransferase [Deinococcus sp.]|uniref:glycosyltransferase n=1 Tax=Deinococcus sp. TaxID=47478 RepID=UPI003CC68155
MTAALIVTYGERDHLLRQVIEKLQSIDIDFVVVVANGVGVKSEGYIKNVEVAHNNVIVCWSDVNTGSSGGIAIGLDYIMTYLEVDYVWMLDDDNVPEDLSLFHLINEASFLADPLIAFHSSRSTNSPDSKRGRMLFPGRSSFFEFDIYTIAIRVLRSILKFKETSYMEISSYRVPYAPYGGLFLSRELINKIGLPNTDFFLYVDDTEYTFRINGVGGSIVILQGSIVHDIDAYWGSSFPKPRLFTQFLFENSFFRSYYSIRNHAFFDKNIWLKNPLVYFFNKFLFLLILTVVAVRHNKLSRLKLIYSAIVEGERGLLGKRSF